MTRTFHTTRCPNVSIRLQVAEENVELCIAAWRNYDLIDLLGAANVSAAHSVALKEWNYAEMAYMAEAYA